MPKRRFWASSRLWYSGFSAGVSFNAAFSAAMRASVKAAMSSAVSCARCDRSGTEGCWAEASVDPTIASIVVPATSAFHMGLSMEFVAAHSEKRTDRTHKLSFGHVEATIHKAEQLRTSAGTRAPVRISLYCDQ